MAASTGRPETHEYLRSLGASTLVDRQELASASGRPLDRERWAGAVDVVGGQTLASVLRQTRYRGTVAACGLTGGNDLPTTVLPFILRGVNLMGVDSVSCPTAVRTEAWRPPGRRPPHRSPRLPHDRRTPATGSPSWPRTSWPAAPGAASSST